MREQTTLEKIAEALGAPTIQADTPDFEAVGRFITSYANAESMLHLIARKLLGVSDEKARIVFSGMRLSDLTDRIRGMLRVDKTYETSAPTIEACLVQLGEIATQRHKLVHRSTTFTFGQLVVTNITTAKSAAHSEIDGFNREMLREMQLDCGSIVLRLYAILSPEKAKAPNEFQRPWRYKPEKPKPPNPQRQKAPGSPKPPPDASGA